MNRKLLKSSLGLILALLVSPLLLADPVWIDVRSAPEHTADHIPGDPLIPYQQIVARVSAIYPDKNTEIRLYCHSGGRAGKALSALQAAGYGNVQNVGGIDDARVARGIVE